jgi:hypothetical protein
MAELERANGRSTEYFQKDSDISIADIVEKMDDI